MSPLAKTITRYYQQEARVQAAIREQQSEWLAHQRSAEARWHSP
ncbi:hypothetical protein ACNKHO_25320 [Shigella flexneri]